MEKEDLIFDSEKYSLHHHFCYRAKENAKKPNEIVKNVKEVAESMIKRLLYYSKFLPEEEKRDVYYQIRHYFKDETLIDILTEKSDFTGIDQIIEDSAIRRFLTSETGNARKGRDFYALYSGFAGYWVGFMGNPKVSISDFYKFSYSSTLDKDPFAQQYFTFDNIKRENGVLVPKKIQEEFFDRHSGFYNVFFIEEKLDGFGKDDIRFGVSNLVVSRKYSSLYFKELKIEKIIHTHFVIMKKSTKNTFYFRENENSWGYLGAIQRPELKKDTPDLEALNDFFMPYLGSIKDLGFPFSGMGYAMKVKDYHQLILPDRGFPQSRLDNLRCWGMPQSTREYLQKQKRVIENEKVYEDFQNNSEFIDDPMCERILKVFKKLDTIGKPLEYRDFY